MKSLKSIKSTRVTKIECQMLQCWAKLVKTFSYYIKLGEYPLYERAFSLIF